MDNIQGILDDIKATDTTIESITAFKELLDKSKPETTTKLVVEEVLPYIFKSDTKNRKVLLNLIFDCSNVDPKYLNKKDAARFKSHVKQEFLVYIDKLGVENNSDWSILCIALFRILGKTLHNDVEIINRILRIIEIGFRNKAVEQKCAAYKCWMELIRNYSLSTSYMRQPKQMKLLIKPLKVQLSRLSCATEIRFDTFMLLLEAIDSDMMNTYIDFLQFVFNIENVATCKPTVVLQSFKNIWPKASAVLFQSLGCEGSVEEICGYKTKICTLVDGKYFESNYKCLVYAARICSELTYQWCAETNIKQIIEPLWTTIFHLSLNCEVQTNVLSNINDHFNELFRNASSNAFVYDFILMTVLEVIYKESELNSAIFRAEVLVPFLKLYITNNSLHLRSRNDAVAQLISFAYSSQTLCDLYPLMESLNYSEVLELIWFQCNAIFVSEVQILRCIDILTYLKWPVGNIKFLNTNQCILKLWKATLSNVYETQPDIISQLLDALKLIQGKNNWIIVNIMIISSILLEIATRKITTMECIALTLNECLDNSSRAIEHFVLYKEDFFDSYLSLSKYMTGNSAVLTMMLRSLEQFIQKLPALIIKSIPKIFVQFMDDSSRLSTSNEAVNVGVKLKPQALHSTPTIISRAKKMASINYSPLTLKPTATILPPSTESSSPSNKKSSSHQKSTTSFSMNTRTKSIMEFADSAFVQIDKEVTVDVSRMSSHQRESLRRRRDDIPALYSDLSQSSQTLLFSETSSNSQELPTNADLEAADVEDNVTDVLTHEKTETTLPGDVSIANSENVDMIIDGLNAISEGKQKDSTNEENIDEFENAKDGLQINNTSDDEFPNAVSELKNDFQSNVENITPNDDFQDAINSENVDQLKITRNDEFANAVSVSELENERQSNVENDTPNDEFQNALDSEDVVLSHLTDLIDDSEGVVEDSPKELINTTTKHEDLRNDVMMTESSDNVVTDKLYGENKMHLELETANNKDDECELKARSPAAMPEKRVTRSRTLNRETVVYVSPKSKSNSPSPRRRPKKLTTTSQHDLSKRDVKNKVPEVSSEKRKPSDEFSVTYAYRPRGRPQKSSRGNVKFVASWIRIIKHDLSVITDQKTNESSVGTTSIQADVTNPTENSLDSLTQEVSPDKQIATDKLKHELNRLRMDIVGGDMAAHIPSKRVRKEKFNLSLPKGPKKSRSRLSLCLKSDEQNSDDKDVEDSSSEPKEDTNSDVKDVDDVETSDSLCNIASNEEYEFKGFECKAESKSEIEKEYIRNELLEQEMMEPPAVVSVEEIDDVIASSDTTKIVSDEDEADNQCNIRAELDTDGVLATNVIMDTQEPIEDDAFSNISFIGSIGLDANTDVHTKDTLSIGIDEFETETCNDASDELIPSSPVGNTTPSKNRDFVDDTVDISPIGGTKLDFSGSPDLFGTETVEVIEKVLEEIQSANLDEESTDEAAKAPPLAAHLTPLKMMQTVSSPKTHRIQKMMEKLGDCSTSDNKEDCKTLDSLGSGEVYKKEDLLEFSADLPKPDARPRTPSILKRKAPDYLDEGISPASKRKRVNFSDPPTTSSKVYLKCDEENFMQRVLKKSGKLSMKPHYLNNDNDMVFNIKVNIKNNAEARIENDCLGTMKEITCEPNEGVADELSDLYPDLMDCSEDVDSLEDVTISKYTGVKTIGDIVRLKRADLQSLSGIPEPKFTRINSALSMYCCTHKSSAYEAQSTGNVHKVISVDCAEKSISNVNIINNIILSPNQMDTMNESPSGITAISQVIKNNIQQLVDEGYSPDDIGDELNNILRSCNLPLTINLPYY